MKKLFLFLCLLSGYFAQAQTWQRFALPDSITSYPSIGGISITKEGQIYVVSRRSRTYAPLISETLVGKPQLFRTHLDTLIWRKFSFGKNIAISYKGFMHTEPFLAIQNKLYLTAEEGLLHSKDGGVNWQTVIPTLNETDAIYFYSIFRNVANELLIGSSKWLYVENSASKPFSEIRATLVEPFHTNWITNFYSFQEYKDILYANAIEPDGSHSIPVLAYSTDKGYTWKKIGNYCRSFQVMSSGRIVCSTTQNSIIVSDNKGLTWRETLIEPIYILKQSSSGVLCGGWYEIWCSSDGGNTWKSLNLGLKATVLNPDLTDSPFVGAMSFDRNNQLWVGVAGYDIMAGLYRYNGALPVANEPEALPKSITLSQNYPNPFNPSTTINFSLPQASEVVLEVFDLLGKRVSLLEKGWQTAGTHQVQFDATNLPSGTYIYRLQVGSKVISQKMTLVK